MLAPERTRAPASPNVRLPDPPTAPPMFKVLPLAIFHTWLAAIVRLALMLFAALADDVTLIALPGVTVVPDPEDVAAVAEVLFNVIEWLPPIVTAVLSLKVMLPRFMLAPVVTMACSVATLEPKMTLTALPLGTTPPAEVPAASDAQLLLEPLERAIAPRAAPVN